MSRDRRHADERSSAGLHHVGHRVFYAEHGAEHVQVEHAEELGGVLHVVGAHAATASGVGHAAVELVGGLERHSHGVLHALLVGHVGDDVLNAPAAARLLPDSLGRVLQLRLGATADRDGRAVRRSRLGARAPDSRPTACHEYGLALESARRSRRHLRSSFVRSSCPGMRAPYPGGASVSRQANLSCASRGRDPPLRRSRRAHRPVHSRVAPPSEREGSNAAHRRRTLP